MSLPRGIRNHNPLNIRRYYHKYRLYTIRGIIWDENWGMPVWIPDGGDPVTMTRINTATITISSMFLTFTIRPTRRYAIGTRPTPTRAVAAWLTRMIIPSSQRIRSPPFSVPAPQSQLPLRAAPYQSPIASATSIAAVYLGE